MKAVIMAGGFGTRLRPLTVNIPKPMVPMMNRPMMEHIINLLKKHGFNDIVSLLYFQPDVIRKHFGDGGNFGIKMKYIQAEADFGTAGSARNAQKLLGKGRVLIISGDVLTDFDLTEAMKFHVERNADATIVLKRMPNPLQFGVVITDEEGNITRFLEKPSWSEVFSDTINTGIYILEREVVDMIPFKEDFDFSKNLFPLMMKEGKKLCGYVAEGYWRDVGTLNEYLEASLDCLNGLVDIDFYGERRGKTIIEEKSVIAADQSNYTGTVVVGNKSKLADTVLVTNSSFGRNVTVDEGAVIVNSVIWDHCQIGRGVHISNAVICDNVIIKEEATINENVFVSERCRIGARATLNPNIKLWPDKVVEDNSEVSKSLITEDRWMNQLFADSRITGRINIEVNPEFGAKLGAALGAMCGKGTQVLASRDPDVASHMIKRAITCGLMSTGVSVLDMQGTVIPLVRQELRSGQCKAGFLVRKSPFLPDTMDIIFFDKDGKDLSSGETKTIERQFFSEDFKRAAYNEIGSIDFPRRSTEVYRERLFSALDTKLLINNPSNVVIDYSFGLASTIFPNIVGNLGAQVLGVNAYLDPKRLPRTTAEFNSAWNHLAGVVKSLSYDIGFLIDAGAERIFASDEEGNTIKHARLLSIVTKLFLESEKLRGRTVKAIAFPVGATAEVDLIAKEYDVTVYRTKNSHSGMMAMVQENKDIAYVGGTRGAFIFPQFLFATDAMYSIAKILEMKAVTGWKLSKIDAMLERLYQVEVEIPCKWEQKGRVLRHAAQEAGPTEGQLDGIRIALDERTWVLMFPSKEYEKFFVHTEADNVQRAQELAAEYQAKVVQWRDNE